LLNFKTWLASNDFKRGRVEKEGWVGGFYQAYPIIKYYNRGEHFFVVSTGRTIIQINGQTHLKGRPEVYRGTQAENK
jgi:hypothetical protein